MCTAHRLHPSRSQIKINNDFLQIIVNLTDCGTYSMVPLFRLTDSNEESRKTVFHQDYSYNNVLKFLVSISVPSTFR